MSLPPASVSNHSPTARILAVVLLLGALVLMVLVAVLGITRHQETVTFSLGIGGVFLAAGAAAIHRPRLLESLTYPHAGRITPTWAAVLVAWLALLAASLLTWTASGWDECAYLLSGLALRGEPVPYAAGRAPVTHFVAALFADAPQWAAPTLGLLLLAILGIWSVKRWGWSVGALPVALLVTQNVFIESFVGLVSELPAALLLLATAFALARGQFFAAGLLGGLAGLARWNLAVAPVAFAICVWLHFGWRAGLRLVLGGALVAAIFLALSFALVDHPLQTIIDNNLRPAYAWTPEGEPPPTLASRVAFYGSHAFFLTPPVLLAIVASLVTIRRRAHADTEEWTLRVALPVGIAVYMATMLNIGGHFPRFFGPVMPCALLVFVEWLQGTVARAHLSSIDRRAWITALVCITAAWGLWPATAASMARSKAAQRPIFAASFAGQLRAQVPRNAQLCATCILPLALDAGLPAMVELRRSLTFPTAERGPNGDLRIPSDSAAAVQALLTTAPPSAYLIVPAEQRQLLPAATILTSDDRWILAKP